MKHMFSAVSLTDAALILICGLSFGGPAGIVALLLTGSVTAALVVGVAASIVTGKLIYRGVERDTQRRSRYYRGN